MCRIMLLHISISVHEIPLPNRNILESRTFYVEMRICTQTPQQSLSIGNDHPAAAGFSHCRKYSIYFGLSTHQNVRFCCIFKAYIISRKSAFDAADKIGNFLTSPGSRISVFFEKRQMHPYAVFLGDMWAVGKTLAVVHHALCLFSICPGNLTT